MVIFVHKIVKIHKLKILKFQLLFFSLWPFYIYSADKYIDPTKTRKTI